MSLPNLSLERNTQQPSPPEMDEYGRLKVKEVYYTIQGEGPFAGRPAVFVRLAGCNLTCPGCDTDYTITDPEHPHNVSPQALATVVASLRPHLRWCLTVITGGEPFRQNIAPAVTLLMSLGPVQIETNGMMWNEQYHSTMPLLNDMLSIVCSPKTPVIHQDIRWYITNLKYVLDADHVDPADGLPTSVLGMKMPPAKPWSTFQGKVYIQPADEADEEKNRRNTEAAINSCLQHGYCFSPQVHKYVGLR